MRHLALAIGICWAITSAFCTSAVEPKEEGKQVYLCRETFARCAAVKQVFQVWSIARKEKVWYVALSYIELCRDQFILTTRVDPRRFSYACERHTNWEPPGYREEILVGNKWRGSEEDRIQNVRVFVEKQQCVARMGQRGGVEYPVAEEFSDKFAASGPSDGLFAGKMWEMQYSSNLYLDKDTDMTSGKPVVTIAYVDPKSGGEQVYARTLLPGKDDKLRCRVPKVISIERVDDPKFRVYTQKETPFVYDVTVADAWCAMMSSWAPYWNGTMGLCPRPGQAPYEKRPREWDGPMTVTFYFAAKPDVTQPIKLRMGDSYELEMPVPKVAEGIKKLEEKK